jgi:hypothetical protein
MTSYPFKIYSGIDKPLHLWQVMAAVVSYPYELSNFCIVHNGKELMREYAR